MDKPQKRGGKREGAGRPIVYVCRLNVSTTLHDADAEWLIAHAQREGKTVSQAVRDILHNERIMDDASRV